MRDAPELAASVRAGIIPHHRVMYRIIYAAVDNSDHSNTAVHLATQLGRAFEAKLVGSHVYAAKLHDVRFKQMEFTLPDEYKEETELEKQRRIHDALIARGLQLISDSYLDVMERLCDEQGLDFEAKTFDGRTFEALVGDIEASGYDLVILGALGQGAVHHSDAGSVCERVLRRTSVDTLVVRDIASAETSTEKHGAIVAAFDGSTASWDALRAAATLARTTGRAVDVVACLPGSPEDDMLLESLLPIARKAAKAQGVSARTTTLEGPAGEALSTHAAETTPWAVAVGRQGLDAEEGDPELGSTVEYLVRKCPSNVLVVAQPKAKAKPSRAVVAMAEAPSL